MRLREMLWRQESRLRKLKQVRRPADQMAAARRAAAEEEVRAVAVEGWRRMKRKVHSSCSVGDARAACP